MGRLHGVWTVDYSRDGGEKGTPEMASCRASIAAAAAANLVWVPALCALAARCGKGPVTERINQFQIQSDLPLRDLPLRSPAGRTGAKERSSPSPPIVVPGHAVGPTRIPPLH